MSLLQIEIILLAGHKLVHHERQVHPQAVLKKAVAL